MTPQLSLRRTFLFLQGPHGAFFPKLGDALRRAGHRVRRINLNGGDQATWPTGTNYHGGTRGWSAYVRRFLIREGVSDLILFGDCRPEHRVAIAAARDLDVRVHVFEEGYVRPDWVTLEREGVNGHSQLPRDPAWYLDQARGLPPVPSNPTLPSYNTARGWAAFFYYAEVVLQYWRFPLHRSHRGRNPVWEGIRYLRRFSERGGDAKRTEESLRRLDGARYFLFPLQLDSDYQIRVHSPFGGMQAAIDQVLESFARHAPRKVMLAVKEHPLDAGLKNWRLQVEASAAKLGIADRIVFLEQGDLLALVEGSLGMVTINSTSGTLSLAAGRPVKVLGNAIYDLPGITDQGSLDHFWTAPRRPDPAIWDAFYRVLYDQCLIHGAFLSNFGIDLVVSVATQRLTAIDQADLLTPALSYQRA